MTPNAQIIEDENGKFKIGFIDNSEAILKIIHPKILDDAQKKGFAANVIQKGKNLHFVVLLKFGLSYKFWWMPFEFCLTGSSQPYEDLAALIDKVHGTSYFPRIMQEAFRWQIRSTHPRFPCEMDETAWDFYETSFYLVNRHQFTTTPQ